MKKTLRHAESAGSSPQQLTPRSSEGCLPQLTPSGPKGLSLPIPAVGFHEAATSSKKIFNNSLKNLSNTRSVFHNKVQRDISKKQN